MDSTTAPAAGLSASAERPAPRAWHRVAGEAVWEPRPWLLPGAPQASVVQPAFRAVGCLFVRLPSNFSEGLYLRKGAVAQRRGFNHIGRTSVNAHSQQMIVARA